MYTAFVATGIVSLWLGRKFFKGPYYNGNERLDGKTVVITGCNTGIGKETALDLSKRGARVVMACRNLDLANIAANDLKVKNPAANLSVCQLDLADLSSVRKCAQEIMEKEKRLDILINNAGVMVCPEMKTKDGFEMQIGVNHFGHFLFTNLLLKMIKASAPARIVTVSSYAHTQGKIDLEDINFEKKPYSRIGAYCQSKLANVLFSNELARRLKGTGVTCYSLHPGTVATDLPRHVNDMLGPLKYLFAAMGLYFIKTPESGAQTTIMCAVDESLAEESGQYYEDCHKSKPIQVANDEELANKFWKFSEEAVSLEIES